MANSQKMAPLDTHIKFKKIILGWIILFVEIENCTVCSVCCGGYLGEFSLINLNNYVSYEF